MPSSFGPHWARAVADLTQAINPRRPWPWLARVWGPLVALALLTGSGATPRTHTITIENMRFNPETLTVKRGERIIWINKDLFPHTATGGKAFDSGAIAASASWTFVMRQPGNYSYSCSFHPTMKGKVTVEQ